MKRSFHRDNVVIPSNGLSNSTLPRNIIWQKLNRCGSHMAIMRLVLVPSYLWTAQLTSSILMGSGGSIPNWSGWIGGRGRKDSRVCVINRIKFNSFPPPRPQIILLGRSYLEIFQFNPPTLSTRLLSMAGFWPLSPGAGGGKESRNEIGSNVGEGILL